jgi:hypothetical protein
MAQFKVGDRVRLSAEAIDTLGSIGGAGATGTILSLEERGYTTALAETDTFGGLDTGWLELAPPAATIDAAKTYTTRDGRAVRIYATDGGWLGYPIHGATLGADGWEPQWWLADGRVDSEEEGADLDLIEVKPEHTRWIVICDAAYGFATREQHAQEIARTYGDSAAVVKVTFREGEGLDALPTL